MKNLITCAFAFKEGYQTSMQLNKVAGNDTREMYLKNLFVALVSAKKNNPEDDVVLSLNEDISDKWKSSFEKEGVKVRVMDFDSFVVPKEFPWSLAFFKMCVLYTFVKEGEYDNYLIMDADTFTTRSYEDMWKEAAMGILLFPLGHTYSHSDRETIRKDFTKFYPDEAKKLPIVHYGGEFVLGNREDLRKYMDVCLEIFEKIEASGFKAEEKIGDESLWSIAAALLNGDIFFITGIPYIYRFWTGENFYLVSSVTSQNPVSIWHLPVEKETGIIRIYDYYRKKGKFPEVKKAQWLLGIVKFKRPFNYITFSNKVKGKLKR